MKHINNVHDPSFLLMYTPQRQDLRFGAVKPEGSLGLIYLAGALRNSDYEVRVLDCSVGDDTHNLQDTFYRQVSLPNGMVRVGLSIPQILEIASKYDVIGISAIFTAQTTMAVEVIRAISENFPDKLIITGGVNARSQQELFFDAGVDIICLSEAEKTILEIGGVLRAGSTDFSSISGIAFKKSTGEIKVHPTLFVEQDLDNLPIPAWDLLPNERYWKIARPHGGGFSIDNPVKYAPLMTSRGCPFKCDFCHIGLEGEGSESGNLRKLRIKSLERVMREMHILKSLGVEHVFIEDDSLLGRKQRAMKIFQEIIKLKVRVSGVNGINIAHLCTSEGGKHQVDYKLLALMAEAGFTKFMLPVESGSQRIIDKYATGKLNLDKHDIVGLIRETKRLGMEVGGNYTYGYPDETIEEVHQTFEIAKRHMEAGLTNANFMIITPFPGTEFYNRVIQEGLFLPEIEIDELDWTKVSIKTRVPKEVLEEMITTGWESVNKPERIRRIRSLNPRPQDSL
jgi:anaerobic magnesium-protoporphyrin IX monomethyl ester cyclase